MCHTGSINVKFNITPQEVNDLFPTFKQSKNMSDKKGFAVKSSLFSLYQAFVKEAELLGFKHKSDFLEPIDQYPKNSNCIYISTNWGGIGKFFAYSNTGYGTKAFDLNKEFGAAVDYLKSITPAKLPTYNEVAKELFIGKELFYSSSEGSIKKFMCVNTAEMSEPNNATSEAQVEKMLALNMVFNICEYLEKDNNPLINGWVIGCDTQGEIFYSTRVFSISGMPLFSSKENCQKATDILGKETIEKAFKPIR